MANYNHTYIPEPPQRPPVKSQDGTVLKVAGIIGLVMASPFIAFIGLFALICVLVFGTLFFGSLQTVAPWALLTLTAVCLLPALRDRINGKHETEKLQWQIDCLQHELHEAKKQIMELEEGADFHRKLAASNNGAQPIVTAPTTSLTIAHSDNKPRS
jgi:hypothetical protein